MGAKPPFNGELGTDGRPTAISTDVLELLTTDADSLVGLARDSAEQQDGTVVYASDSGVPTDLAVWVDGTKRPVTGVEWVDSSGTARPVTEWHVGPRSFFDVTITGTNSPVTAGETLDVTADVTNSGATAASDTIFLQRAVQTYDAVTVSGLASGATTSITLSWDTQSGDDGDYTLEVASSDDTASTSVTVAAVPNTVVSRTQDDGPFSTSGKLGVRFTTSQQWPDIGATISSETSGLTDAYVYRVSDSVLMGSTDISNLTAGDSFFVGLSTSLSANETYNFVGGAGGATYDSGNYGFASFPYTSNDGNLEIVKGGAGPDSTSGNPHNFSAIGDV